ncbi:hypothetical protein MBLNU459_g6037t1 [Dothideomycetes sp. NU459]
MTETLRLFPSTVPTVPAATPKSCLKDPSSLRKGRVTNTARLADPDERLQGLAMHMTARKGKTVHIEPANAHIKHTLFCNPVVSPKDGSHKDGDETPSTVSLSRKDSVLENRTPNRSESRALSNRDKPLPGSPPSRMSDYNSVRSGSPTLVRSNSGASAQPHASPLRSQPRRSIFPEYNHQLPLSQQPYYPAEPAAARRTQFRRLSSSLSQQTIHSPTFPTSPFSAEVPVARLPQLRSVWAAATGDAKSCRTEKTRLVMHRDVAMAGNDTGLEFSFGSEEGRPLYSAHTSGAVPSEHGTDEMLIRRHHPLNEIVVPVMQLDVPTASDQESNDDTTDKGILLFPQTAALDALEAAATSHKAASIAQYDPRASSPQAAQLAYEAVASAKANEACRLVRSPGDIDAQGALEHGYELQHPRLGMFSISVHGRVGLLDDSVESRRRSSPGRQVIRLHHCPSEEPSATPTVLATLDASGGTLELDLAAMRILDCRYMTDIAVCAVLAVAVQESRRWRTAVATTPVATFAAPPPPLASPDTGARRSSKRSSASAKLPKISRWRRALTSKLGSDRSVSELKPVSEMPAPPRSKAAKPKKLPAITRGLLHLLGFSFEATVWLLGLGVKVVTKVLISVSGAISKA